MRQLDLPMQPAYIDKHGRPRFQENKIVSYMLAHPDEHLDLNTLVLMDFPQEDWEQFYQLIGYSLSGYMELNKVGDRGYFYAKKTHAELLKMKETQDNNNARR